MGAEWGGGFYDGEGSPGCGWKALAGKDAEEYARENLVWDTVMIGDMEGMYHIVAYDTLL